MLAILYLFIALLFGDRLRRLLLPPARDLYASFSSRDTSDVPAWLFDLPAAAVMGLPPMMWLTYAAAWLAAWIPGLSRLSNPLLLANLVVIPLIFILSLAMTGRLRDRAANRRLIVAADEVPAAGRDRPSGRFLRESSIYLFVMAALLLFGLWFLRVSLFVDGSQLRAGYSVFSDFAPHTALVSSFARGANYPTQYPHFALDGIRYHFIFYFLCGNLDYLGLPIDWAINLPSLLGMVSFSSLLGLLGVLVTGRRTAFLAAPALFFLRSSFAIFTFLRGRTGLGDSLAEAFRTIGRSTVFIGDTLHEDWGLFAINVYANQRHFLFGLSLLLFLLFLFLPLLRSGLRPAVPEQGRRPRFLRWEGWAIPSGGVLAAALLTVVCLPYLHGSVLVAALLILGVLCVFSNGRLQYLLVAAAGIGAAVLQARLFAGGTENVASFRLLIGFLADKPTLWSIILYATEVFGVAFFLLFLLPWIQPSRFRTVLAVSFLAPFLFAFTVSLTPDVTVNHKYLMISVCLMDLLIVDLVGRLWEKPRRHPLARRVDLEEGRTPGPPDAGGRGLAAIRAKLEATGIGRIVLGRKSQLRAALMVSRRVLAVLLVILLTATGVADVVTYAHINRNTVAMDLESPVTDWILAHTDPNDVFLTDTYAYNEFFYSGRPAYYGHSYYAWSAGHDTGARDRIYRRLLGGCGGDYNTFRTLCMDEGISYLLATDSMRKDPGTGYNDAFFQANFAVLARFPTKDNATVYDLR